MPKKEFANFKLVEIDIPHYSFKLSYKICLNFKCWPEIIFEVRNHNQFSNSLSRKISVIVKLTYLGYLIFYHTFATSDKIIEERHYKYRLKSSNNYSGNFLFYTGINKDVN